MMEENKNMIYGINSTPPFGKLILFATQLLLSVFVATVLIANICGVPVSGALFGAGAATLAYLSMTGFSSCMYISNSGAFVAPVMIALSAGGYKAVAIGGLTTCVVYTVFGLIFRKVPVSNIYKIFPKALIGAVTVVIGISLMGFIGTYVQIDGSANTYGILVALLTAVIIALISHYAHGLFSILPFLFGTLAGYAAAVGLTVTGVCCMVDFSVFSGIKLFSIPDLAVMHWEKIDVSVIVPVAVVFVAYTVSAMMECLSDHAALSGIVGVDLYENPGLSKIFIGEGVANIFSSFLGGLSCTSYGEGIACVGFSKVASTAVTAVAAVLMILLSFLVPVQAFIASIPSCVFGGAAIILYGYIACSGVKMLQKIDLNVQKNLIIVSSVLSIGVSGIAIGGDTFSLSGTALALIAGVFLNLILTEKAQETTEEVSK